jgi:hypothetical protein
MAQIERQQPVSRKDAKDAKEQQQRFSQNEANRLLRAVIVKKSVPSAQSAVAVCRSDLWNAP